MTNSFSSPNELPGIRDVNVKIFKYKGLYSLVRPVTSQDLKDEDFVQWLSSMWKHDELNLKSFIKYKREYDEKEVSARRVIQKRTPK